MVKIWQARQKLAQHRKRNLDGILMRGQCLESQESQESQGAALHLATLVKSEDIK